MRRMCSRLLAARRVTHTEGIHHALFKLLILPAISARGRLLPDIEAGTLNGKNTEDAITKLVLNLICFTSWYNQNL